MMNKLYRFRYMCIFLSFFGLLLVMPGLFAQVNRAEIENLEPVEFINYQGPIFRFDTRAQIHEIGFSLGMMVRNGQSRAGATGRYFVINSVSSAEGLRMDADIFGLGVDVAVEHIRNLRLIIQGYLEGAYNYSERDAAVLAEYITIYNAIYRGDFYFFDSRYKDPVMEHLSQEKVGLSIRFDEWPGQTLIVIPLGLVRPGPLSSIDTSSLIDTRVTELLREESDMGLGARKEMAALLDRQAEEAVLHAAIRWSVIREEEVRLSREGREFLIDQLQELEKMRRQALEAEEYAVKKAGEAQEERKKIAEDLLSRIG